MISHHTHEMLPCLSPHCAPERAQHSQQLLVLGSAQIPVPPPAQHPQLWPFLVGSGWRHSSLSMAQGHPGGSSGSGAVLQAVVPTTGTLSAPVTLSHCSRDKMTNLIILTSILSPSSSEFTSSPYALMEGKPAFFFFFFKVTIVSF